MGKKKKQDKQDKPDKLKKNKQKTEKSGKHDKQGKAEQKVKDIAGKKAGQSAKDIGEKKAGQSAKDTTAKKAEEKTEDTAAKRSGRAKPLTGRTSAKKSSAAKSPDTAQTDMAAVLRAFGDVHRLQILDLLKEQELSAGELLEFLDIVQSTLSHHMKLLVETGIVKCRKQGKWSYYSIDQDKIVQVSEYLLKWR